MTKSIDWIHSRLKFGSRPGLLRINYLLDKLGQPQDKIKTIHVAGTNGKGSTVTFLSGILKEYGLKIGTFTSPYIEVFNERIAINGEFISDHALDEIVAIIKPIVSEMDQDEEVAGITEFELLTAIGFYFFEREKVDFAIIEVGLGGALDCTNVIVPEISVITTIGLDHQDILGDSIELIARQKAGIIKANTPVVVGDIEHNALVEIEKIAKENNCHLYRLKQSFTFESKNKDFHYHGLVINSNFKLGLSGNYQKDNASVALATFEVLAKQIGLEIDYKRINRGLLAAFWPARMESINGFILDGAHNPHAIKRLTDEFMDTEKPIHILFSALNTKDYQTMLKQLLQIPKSDISVTTFDYPNAIDLHTVETSKAIKALEDWHVFINQEKKENEIYLITGSLYFLSQVRAALSK